MNLYEAIYLRRSVREFRMEPISDDILKKVREFYLRIEPLFPGIGTEIGITENPEGNRVLKGFFGVTAPYYLSIYSEERDKAEMNAGFIMEQISLFMLTLGLGSCFLGGTSIKKMPKSRGDKSFVILMAFGLPKERLTRRSAEARRLPIKDLCIFKNPPKRWMTEVLEAARLAPSALNRQPWRFVVLGNRIHIFMKKYTIDRPRPLDEFNFGIMFSHICIASEELWLDVDLIRLEDISQKSFRTNQYVLSAVVKDDTDHMNLQ